MLGIPTVTLRAWENRHGAVEPQRTESGYRLYSDQDIQDLKWLKEQTELHGMAISQAVRLLKERQKHRNVIQQATEMPAPTESQLYAQMSSQIYELLLRFEGEQGNKLIDLGFSMYGYDAMLYEVLIPVLTRAGTAWERGEASVAQEHYMTNLIAQRFYSFYHIFPVDHTLPKVVLFCPSGEHHHIGLLLFGLFLRRQSIPVIYLGADTPIDGVRQLIVEHDISWAGMSISDRSLLPVTEQVIHTLSKDAPNLKFVLGGKVFDDHKSANAHSMILSDSQDDWNLWLKQCYFAPHKPE